MSTVRVATPIRKPRSRRLLWAWVISILLIATLAGVFDFPTIWNSSVQTIARVTRVHVPEWHPRPFRLGLDLLGGTELVYDADVSHLSQTEQAAAVEGARDVIERRVNSFGVAEPVVQTVHAGSHYRIVAELAGIKDVNQAIKMIGETPVLDFKEQGATSGPDSPLAKAQTIVDLLKKKFTTNPRADFSLTAKDAGATYQDLTTVTRADKPEWSEWLSAHGVGARTVPNPIESGDGWHFLELVSSSVNGKEFDASHLLICYQGAQGCTKSTTKDDARKQIDDLAKQATPANFATLAKANSTDPSASTTGGTLGWSGPGRLVPAFEATVNAMRVGTISGVVETPFGFHLIYKTAERPRIVYHLHDVSVLKPSSNDSWVSTGLSGKQLTKAVVQFDPNTGAPTVSVTFNDEGKKLFGAITARNVGKPIAIFLDGGVISAPTVQQEIDGGSAIISGNFTVVVAKQLAQRLNAGALPVPITLDSQQTVGATLGQDSLSRSLVAGLIGFALVALFMVLYYRMSGVLAVLALTTYTVFMLALFKLIPVTISLAGIAGFVLSIGIAVDANVLIFERMKEELSAGRTLASAIEEGFRRAWPSIRDGNTTTLISSAVLFWFSSSVIKGFALTLGLGVVLSLFSAMMVSRAFLELVSVWPWKKHTSLFVPFVKRPAPELATVNPHA